jgi:hypothetical protein
MTVSRAIARISKTDNRNCKGDFEWMPYQVKFVRCFADEHIHLGMRVTSRAEGSVVKI